MYEIDVILFMPRFEVRACWACETRQVIHRHNPWQAARNQQHLKSIADLEEWGIQLGYEKEQSDSHRPSRLETTIIKKE